MLQNPQIRRFRYRLWRAMCMAMPNKQMTYHLPDQVLFRYPLRGSISGNIIAGGYELNEAMFVRKFLQPGDIFVDIGANGGYFSLIAARRIGETGQVIAFEPDPNAVSILRNNIKLNRLNNIKVIQSAVSQQDGEADFGVATDGAMSALAKNSHPLQEIKGWYKVPTVKLDTILQDLELTKVKLIKIDVEGAEALVLAGGVNTLSAPTAPVIMCEFSDRTATGFNSSGRQLWQQFCDYGYHMFTLAVEAGQLKLIPAASADTYSYENVVACKQIPQL